MAVLLMSKKNLPEIDRRLGEGSSSISFKTKDDQVLKRYLNNEMYKRILEHHNGYFLEYLIELMKLDVDILVTPNDLFVLKNYLVGALTYDYQRGTTLDKMYPRTDLEKLFLAFDKFYDSLEDIDYLYLNDMHYRNIVYTGDIRLIDLDFSRFSDKGNVVSHNIAHINKHVIKGVLGIDVLEDYVVDDKLKSTHDSALNGEISATTFLREYRDLIIDSKGQCRYVKELTKDFVRVK